MIANGTQKTALVLLLLGGLSLCRAAQAQQDLPATYDGRAELIVDSLAQYTQSLTLEEFKASDDFEGGKYGAYPTMALFERGHLEKARRFAAHQLVGGGAMFREYTTMALYMEYHDLYGEELWQKVKENQLESNFFAPGKRGNLSGASENHKLMYAAAAYLGGQAWPEEYPDKWYEAGRKYLHRWFEEVVEVGFWEQDSPTYMIHHMGPILSVADHAPPRSPMKKKAEMVLDWYFASVAGEYLHGYWITASSRDYDPLFGLAHSAETTALMWLAFGDAPFLPDPHEGQPFRHWKATLHFAVSDYRVPDILRRIATDRDEAFVHRELMMRNPMYPREYNYVAPPYGVASIIGEGEHIPPDMTRWKVQWVADRPDDEPSVFLMKHPKPGEDDWTEWQGASPAEQVLQHEGTLVAVYRVNDDWKPFIDGPVFEESYEAIRHDDNALYLHAGEVLLAVRAVNGLQFEGDRGGARVLKSTGRRNGLVVDTAPATAYSGGTATEELDGFIGAVEEKTTLSASGMETRHPAVTYTSLSGDTLAIRFDEYRRVNGEAPDLSSWPLLDNPWMHQPVGAAPMHRPFPTSIDAWKRHETGPGHLRLEHGGQNVVYDFESWTVQTGEGK